MVTLDPLADVLKCLKLNIILSSGSNFALPIE